MPSGGNYIPPGQLTPTGNVKTQSITFGSPGLTGGVDISNFMSGNIQSIQAAGKVMSGAWLECINDSDSFLGFGFDVATGGTAPPVPPGGWRQFPIPVSATLLTWTVIYCNAAASHPNQLLTVILFDPLEVANGMMGTGIYSINPSTPATSITPGPLPEGVTIGADDVTAETFQAGVLLPAGQVSAGTLIAGVHETQINSDGGAFTSNGSGDVQVKSLNTDGTIPAANVNIRGSGFNYTGGQAQPANSGNIGTFMNSTPVTVDQIMWTNGWRLVPASGGSYPAAALSVDTSGNVTGLSYHIVGSGKNYDMMIAGAANSFVLGDANSGEAFWIMTHLANTVTSENLTLAGGTQETGVCGQGAQLVVSSSVTMNIVQNFRCHMTNTPSSITFGALATSNVTSGPVTDTITRDGFTAHVVFGTGGGSWFGTYTTVGN